MGLRPLKTLFLWAGASMTMAACQWLVALEGGPADAIDAGGVAADVVVDDRARRYATLYSGPLAVRCLTAPIVGPTDSISLYVGGSLDNHPETYEWRFDDIELRSTVVQPAFGAPIAPTSSASCSPDDPNVTNAWPHQIWCNNFDAVPASDAGSFGFAGALGIPKDSPNVYLDGEDVASPPSSLFFRFPPQTSELTSALFKSWAGIDTSSIRLDFKFRFGPPGTRAPLDRNLAFLLLGIGREQAGVAFGAARGELAVAFLPRVVESTPIEAAALLLGTKVDPTRAFLPLAIEITSKAPTSIECVESCLFRDAGCD